MKAEKNSAPVAEKAKLTPIGAIRYIIGYSSVIFTAISLVLLIFWSLSENKEGMTFTDPARFLAIYPFALCASAASLVFKAKIKTAVQVIIHYAVTIFSFYLFICAPIKSSTNPVAIIALASLLYFIGIAVYLGIRAAINKKKREEIPYQAVYGKITKK